MKHKGETHFACKEIIDEFNGEALCCACTGHPCKREIISGFNAALDIEPQEE